MLNKELFFVVGSPTIEGHTKLTVGSYTQNGSTSYGLSGANPLTKTPQWYSSSKDTLLSIIYLDTTILSSGKQISRMGFDDLVKAFYDTFRVKVLETGVTVTLNVNKISPAPGYAMFQYQSDEILFTAADVGKTFTLEFDPPPDGYL